MQKKMFIHSGGYVKQQNYCGEQYAISLNIKHNYFYTIQEFYFWYIYSWKYYLKQIRGGNGPSEHRMMTEKDGKKENKSALKYEEKLIYTATQMNLESSDIDEF